MELGNYTISSTPIKYPYKAYPSQIGMIDRVIKSLQRSQNCLIESPTGSGKSLALLCAVLAWRQNEFEQAENEVMKNIEKKQSVGKSVSAKSLSSSSSSSTPGGSKTAAVIDLTSDDSYSEYDDANRFIDLTTSPLSERSGASRKEDGQGDDSVEMTEEMIREKVWEARKRIPKIYFGTRTHKQLSQLIRELKKTAYANCKMTILASRDQSCINEEVRRESDRGEACRALINPSTAQPTMAIRGSCAYHTKWKKQFQKPTMLRGVIRREQFSGDVESPSGTWDIEDLVEIGQKHGFCPYFAASNTLLTDAELIFCPYNYLIDPLVRNSVNLDLKGQIIIFDEAHNIEDVCRDAASFVLTQFELEEAAENYNIAASFDESHPAKFPSFLEKICRRLLGWLHEVASGPMTLQSHQVQVREWRGPDFMNVLAKLELLPATATSIQEAIREINDGGNDEGGSDGRRQSGAWKNGDAQVTNAANKTMEKLMYFLQYFYKMEAEDYRICVKQEQSYSGDSRRPFPFRNASIITISLNLWCMNPASAFGDIGNSARSIILASGTLAPMKTFAMELGVKFDLQLEAMHVLPKDRMFVASVAKGPSGRSLRVTYQNTSEWAFQDELGQLVLDICTTVPYGILCFFPSYKLLDALSDRWKSTGLLNRLAAKKVVVVEPKMSEQLHTTMQQFYDAIQHPSRFGTACTGAIFMAVCRGKVSEGLDFADNNARAVITIGIPYPNVSGLEVVNKRDYNDGRIRSGKKGGLSGDQWYEIQAYRALNQALGRCLRHKADWGALILVDERFGSRDSQRYCSNLSRWIRENIRHYNVFDTALADLGAFTNRLTESSVESGEVVVKRRRNL